MPKALSLETAAKAGAGVVEGQDLLRSDSRLEPGERAGLTEAHSMPESLS